jgi:protein-disulfide isomerase
MPTELTPRLTLPVGPRDHVSGNSSAGLSLVEYGDFECPQCAQAYAVVKELQGTFGDRLSFVFRNFPLTNAHPHAQRAAEAAEWAAGQGAFWPMYDALYDQQTKLSEGRILELARGLGLDPASLQEAWASHRFFPRVKEDFASGLASEVKGTPTFFINGSRHDGAWDPSSLGEALERAAGDATPTAMGSAEPQRSG